MQSQRPGPFIPRMPWFEPSDEPSAKASLLSQAVTESDHFTFPADHDFWNNFVQEVQRYPGAMNRPHYHVDASHTDQSVLVNQEFLRRFVSGWEKANPHVVVVSTPHGASTFHSSEEFWNRFVTMAGQRSRMRAARGELGLEDTTVTSKMLPNMAPIKTTEEDWNDICRTWEQEKSVGNAAPPPQPPAPLPPPPAPITQVAPPPPMMEPVPTYMPAYDDQSMQLGNQRKQIEDLQQQLSQVTRQASANNTAIADELRRAQNEASRYQQESESLRGGQQRLQSEKDNLEARIRSLEQALGGLQSDVSRQREMTEKELQDKDKQLEEARQAADMADLKKELQMRELMQEELYRAKEDAQRESEERSRQEAAQRQQQGEISCMRQQLKEAACGNRRCRSTKCRSRQVANVPTSPPPLAMAAPVPAQIMYCGQRTVTTQTPPVGAPPTQYQPVGLIGQPQCSPPRDTGYYPHSVITPSQPSGLHYSRGW